MRPPLVTLALVALVPIAGIVNGVPSVSAVTLEAEQAALTAPMRKAADSGACGGQYIVADRTSSDAVPEDGRATFRFQVPTTGKYTLWGRVSAADDGSDSFYLRVAGGRWLVWDIEPRGTQWHWVVVTDRAEAGGHRRVVFSLSAGPKTLELAYREAGTKLDRLLLTDDLNLKPAEGCGDVQVASSPQAPPARGPEEMIYSNNNIAGVYNGPTQPTRFTLREPVQLTSLLTYHWNNGRGKPPGTIGLKHSDGTMYGPWTPTPYSGQGGVPNAYWIARPNAVLKSGTYTVLDSDPATWAQNSQSGGQGMVEVKGFTVAGTPGGPSPQPPAPPREEAGGRGYTSLPVQQPSPGPVAAPVPTRPIPSSATNPTIVGVWLRDDKRKVKVEDVGNGLYRGTILEVGTATQFGFQVGEHSFDARWDPKSSRYLLRVKFRYDDGRTPEWREGYLKVVNPNRLLSDTDRPYNRVGASR